MRELQLVVDDVLEAQLEALYRRHGPWEIMKALIWTSLRGSRPWARNRVSDLSNHMRRDIGLHEVLDEDEPQALALRRFL